MVSPENSEELWGLFRHFFPDLSRNHARVYRLLWRIEPLPAEAIVKEAGLARSTIYLVLHDLLKVGLIKKTNLSPVSYFAENPVAAYSDNLNQLSIRLKRGKELISQLVLNDSSLSEEIYLIELDGGQKRLISKKNRQTVLDEFTLRDIRRTAEEQIKQAEQAKLKPWMINQ
ncbi:MAG: helix-turn-helix domain-containing protein [Candidatus Diapherotrites archaeon]